MGQAGAGADLAVPRAVWLKLRGLQGTEYVSEGVVTLWDGE